MVSLKTLQGLADKFAAVKDDSVAVGNLADSTRRQHPHDAQVGQLCDDMKSAADGAAVQAIVDAVKARTE